MNNLSDHFQIANFSFSFFISLPSHFFLHILLFAFSSPIFFLLRNRIAIVKLTKPSVFPFETSMSNPQQLGGKKYMPSGE